MFVLSRGRKGRGMRWNTYGSEVARQLEHVNVYLTLVVAPTCGRWTCESVTGHHGAREILVGCSYTKRGAQWRRTPKIGI